MRATAAKTSPPTGRGASDAAFRRAYVAIAIGLLAAFLLNGLLTWHAAVAAQRLQAREVELVRQARVLEGEVPEMLADKRGYLLTMDPAYLEDLAEDQEDARSALRRLRAMVQARNGVALLESIEIQLEYAIAEIEQQLARVELGQLDAVRAAVRESRPARRELFSQLDALVELEEQLLQERIGALQAERVGGLALSAVLLIPIALLAGKVLRRSRADIETSQQQLAGAVEQVEQTNHALAGANAQLTVSAQRLALALDAGQLGAWEWEVSSETAACSERWEQLAGLRPGSFPGTAAAFLETIHPDERPAFEQAARQALADRSRFAVEHRIVRPSGEVRWMATSGRTGPPITGDQDRLAGVMADVTQRHEAEQRREQVARDERLRALGQLAGGVAHNINQSLALIAGHGDLAARAVDRSEPDLAETRESIAIVRRAAMDGGHIVRRLLSFAQTPSAAAPETVDVGVLLDDVAKLTAPRWRDASAAEGCPIVLRVDTAGEPLALGWPVALREALTNLVLNAVDAMPSGGTIRLHARGVGDRVELLVGDDGAGMSPEVQARVFEPFFTTKGSKGTGLGLATVFGVVERHGGTIRVTSTPNRGTTFCLSLPAAGQAPPSIDRAIVARRAPDHQLRVLAVDDEPAIGRMMARMLEPDGHTVMSVASGEAAVECLREHTFDVVISDVGLQDGMSGWDLADYIRREHPDVRLVLATGWGAQLDLRAARVEGVAAIVSKPFLADDLRRAIVGDRSPVGPTPST